MPSEWTDAEIHKLLNQSPWAKEGSISDTTQRGSLGSTAAGGGGGGGRRRGRGAASPSGATTNTGPPGELESHSSLGLGAAGPRSAYPGAPGELPEEYILNVFGEVPGVDPDSGDAILKDNTTLEHKGDQVKLNRAELAPKNSGSEAGTLFYFSRLLALKLEDQEVTFTTKLGLLKATCKFTLKDLLYRGNLEL